jgi:hypothetical protein
MSYLREFKKMEAARNRQVRESVKHQKELQRRLKEEAKLSELERARLEVDSSNTEIEVLLSIHKEVSSVMDWKSFAYALPPHKPLSTERHQSIAALRDSIKPFASHPFDSSDSAEKANLMDAQEFSESLMDHEKELSQFERMQSLSRRVLAGDTAAFGEALSEFSAIAEIANLGASISVTFNDARAVSCTLSVNGNSIIPTEVKSLTVAGKLSVKAMPKARFHEIYQDYVCSSVLRVAREIFALLPLDIIIVTAMIEADSSSKGKPCQIPVLSVMMPRHDLEQLDFDRIDPSDALMSFVSRGDARASRKSGAFQAIAPLAFEDITTASPSAADFQSLMSQISALQKDLTSKAKCIEIDGGRLPVSNSPES